MSSTAKLVMCGCHEAGYPTVRYLLENGIPITHFMILSPEQSTKYQISGYFDYRPLAEDFGVPYSYPKTYSLKSGYDQAFFDENRFDLILQGGWQRLFPKKIFMVASFWYE